VSQAPGEPLLSPHGELLIDCEEDRWSTARRIGPSGRCWSGSGNLSA